MCFYIFIRLTYKFCLQCEQFDCGNGPGCASGTTSCAGSAGNTTGCAGIQGVLQVVVVVLVDFHQAFFFISDGGMI